MTACRELTGIEPEIRPTRTNLETYFVKSVLAAGQPEKAASTTDSAALQLPPFLLAS
jgi:hypothetical protein